MDIAKSWIWPSLIEFPAKFSTNPCKSNGFNEFGYCKFKDIMMILISTVKNNEILTLYNEFLYSFKS